MEEEVKTTEDAEVTASVPTVTAEGDPVEEETVAEEQVEPTTEEVVTPEIPATETVYYYNGLQVVERLGRFDAEGAEECRLSDDTTGYVPKSVFGE